jgi:WD40 repeat protein
MKKIGKIFLLALIVLTASCQSAAPTVLPTTAPAQSLTQTPAPTQTSAPSATPTATASLELTLAPTDTPEPAPTSAADSAQSCLVISGVPLAFLGDNDHLLYQLVAENEAGLKVVDLATGQSADFLTPPQPAAWTSVVVALSPTGDRLALSTGDNTIQIYRLSDRKLLHTLSGHTGPVTELEFSPDGEKLYSASHDTWVKVWDRDGKETGAFQPTGADNFPGEVLGMGLSPDGRLLATIPFDGKTKLWDAQTFQLLGELGAFGGYDNSDAWFSPDGQHLAAITANGLFLWKVDDGTELMGGNPGINAMALAWSPGGNLVYWDIQASSEITFRSAGRKEIIRSLPTSGGPIWGIFFSPDGSLMVAASNIETRIWRTTDWEWLYQGKPECP